MLLDLLGREHFASTKDYSGCYFSYSNYESKNNNHIQEAMINDMHASNFDATSNIQNAPMYFHILHGVRGVKGLLGLSPLGFISRLLRGQVNLSI